MDPTSTPVQTLRDRDLEAWLERALRTPARRADPEPVVHDLDE